MFRRRWSGGWAEATRRVALTWLMCGSVASAAAEVRIQRSIPYKTLSDGTQLLADVYLPSADIRSQDARPLHPALLMIHGGAWFSGNKVHVSSHARFAAEHGYVVVAINYRLAPQYPFPAQIDDCRDALLWMKEQAATYEIDAQRLGVYGYSAGGQLACLLGCSQNNRRQVASQVASQQVSQPIGQAGRPSPEADKGLPPVRAVVAGGAPCEFSWVPAEATTLVYWLGGTRAAKPDQYAAASPIEFVDAKDPPTFLFHGTGDRIVPLATAQRMIQRLSRAEVESRLHLVPDANHIQAFLDEPARGKAIEFLDHHLRARTSSSRQQSLILPCLVAV